MWPNGHNYFSLSYQWQFSKYTFVYAAHDVKNNQLPWQRCLSVHWHGLDWIGPTYILWALLVWDLFFHFLDFFSRSLIPRFFKFLGHQRANRSTRGMVMIDGPPYMSIKYDSKPRRADRNRWWCNVFWLAVINYSGNPLTNHVHCMLEKLPVLPASSIVPKLLQ